MTLSNILEGRKLTRQAVTSFLGFDISPSDQTRHLARRFYLSAKLSLLQSAIGVSRAVNILVHAVILTAFAFVVAAYAVSLLIEWHVESSLDSPKQDTVSKISERWTNRDAVADSIIEAISPATEAEEALLNELIECCNHADYLASEVEYDADYAVVDEREVRREELQARTVSQLHERLAFLNVPPRRYRKLRKAELIQLILDTELT